MTTKLKRTLFIGLGGTGAEAVLYTKRNFIDAYGEIPPMISFLSIDTDNSILNKRVTNRLGEEIRIDGNEFVYSKVSDARAPYMAYKETLFNWLPDQNVSSLKSMLHGAGQIRSNGRFALFFNHNDIITAVDRKLGQILHLTNEDSKKYKANGDGIEINFVFSVGGGTGCGSFLDIAYLVQDNVQSYPNPKSIQAFVVLPDIYAALGPNDIKLQNVKPNGYGALQELDYLMHLDYDSLSPWTIKYENKTINVKQPPFDLVFTISNQNRIGNMISEISEVSELIGLGMFTGASELSAGIASTYDNVKSAIATEQLHIHNKQAWVNGMGISEAVYDGNKLGNIYAHTAINLIINRLLSKNITTTQVNAFIDDDEVKIRENNNYDDVIDSLLSPTPSMPLSYIDKDDPKGVVASYLASVEEQAKENIEKNYATKLDKVESELKSFLIKTVNTENGVGDAIEFIAQLKSQINIFRNEMIEEQEELQARRPNLDYSLDVLFNELEDVKNSFKLFGKDKSIKDKLEEIILAVTAITGNIHELLRRDWAIKFFNKLDGILDTNLNKLTLIKTKLNNIRNNSIQKINYIYNELDGKNKTFVIELHKLDMKKVNVDLNDLQFHQLLEKINYGRKIFDFSDIEEEQIETCFWEYARNLKHALTWRNKSVEEVLAGMSEEELSTLMNQLAIKSTPLWSYDFKGLRLSPNLFNEFVIGVPNEEGSIIKKNLKENKLSITNDPNSKVMFTSTGAKDRIVFYRMESAVPVYALNDVFGYKRKYELSPISHHIDRNFKTRMDREKFSIMPKVEGQEEKMAAWVSGFIYGFIRNNEGTYEIYSLEKGDALDDYWLPLASNNYRDDAYRAFQEGDLLDEIESMVTKKVNEMGSVKNDEIVTQVKSGSNYLKEISQVNMSPEDLRKKEWSSIRDLITMEIDFVTKRFAN